MSHYNLENGFLQKNRLLNEKVSYKDYGGGTIVHVTGGLFALISGLILGPRIMKLKDFDENGITDG